MDLEINDQVFLVTGGSRGLGFATAADLVAEGARVVLVSRSAEHLAQARESLGVGADRALADRALTVAGDLADATTISAAIDQAHAEFGRIDGALLSVGGPAPGPALLLTDEQWRESFESVFLGAVRAIRGVVADWQDRPPAADSARSIVVTLSNSVKTPLPPLGASNGLRPGLAMIVKDLSQQLGPEGIRINGIMPGRIATERLAELDGLAGDAAAARRRNEQLIPMRRYGRPSEFGDLAAFLLSHRADYISGAIIPVDGGLLPTI